MSSHVLDEEVEYFEAHRQEWLLSHANEFALVKGCQLLGMFPTFEEAANKGLKLLGLQDMLIKQVLAEDPVNRLYSPWYSTLHADSA